MNNPYHPHVKCLQCSCFIHHKQGILCVDCIKVLEAQNELPIYDNFMTPEDTVRDNKLYKSIVTRPDGGPQ